MAYTTVAYSYWAPLLLCFVNDIVTPKCLLHYPTRDLLREELSLSQRLNYTMNTEADCTLIQKDINNLIEWSKKWQLPFKFSKSEFLCVTNKMSPVTTTIWILKS